MTYQAGKSSPKRAKPNYIYSILSIFLVLFMLGILSLIVLFASQLTDYFKENIQISVILKDNARQADIVQVQKQLNAETFIKSTYFVSKDEAARIFSEQNSEDFMEFLGYNPLYASIDIHLNASYANLDSLQWIESQIMRSPVVKELSYQKGMIKAINNNARRVGIVITVLSIILLLIAIASIDSTTRLAMYSNRFLIKSMQLVGATRWFITKPFIAKSILNGLIGGVLAIGALIGMLYYVQMQIPELAELLNRQKLLVLFLMILLLGIFISWFSTQRSIRKYLRMKLEELY